MLCLTTAAGSAQTNSDQATATLQSGDKVSVFYGKDALKYACEAARDSGDVITLSAGLFNATTIQKSLHIIGNGFVKDEANGKYPTIIYGNLEFKPRETADGGTTIGYDGTKLEGFIHSRYAFYYTDNVKLQGKGTINNFSIIKCKLTVGAEINTATKNLTIRQCVAEAPISLNNKAHGNIYVAGSYLSGFSSHSSDGIVTMDHTVFNGSLAYGKASNSILAGAGNGIMAESCIFMETTPDNVIGASNRFDCKYADVFKNDVTNLEWSDDENHFALKYPDEYVGTDGTQVGLYGGPYPYNPTPTTPQITKSDIDTTVGADGILKVSVTVEAQTEN